MTNNEIPDINKILLEMDGGEVSEEESVDFSPSGNEVGADDLLAGMGESVELSEKSFVVEEETPQIH